jgi:hypothetical protein
LYVCLVIYPYSYIGLQFSFFVLFLFLFQLMYSFAFLIGMLFGGLQPGALHRTNSVLHSPHFSDKLLFSLFSIFTFKRLRSLHVTLRYQVINITAVNKTPFFNNNLLVVYKLGYMFRPQFLVIIRPYMNYMNCGRNM